MRRRRPEHGPSRSRPGWWRAPRAARGAVLTAVLAASVVLAPEAVVHADPPLSGMSQSSGMWGAGFDWPMVPIHTAVLPDGRVLGFGGQADSRASAAFSYAVWDPARGESSAAIVELPNTTTADFFCGAAIVDPESGRLLIAGGDMTQMDNDGTAHVTNVGNQSSNFYEPTDNTLTAGPPLNVPRWYPSLVTLPDGRVLVHGGADRNGGSGASTPEVYDPGTGSWTMLTGAADADAYNSPELRWWYPHSWVEPNGKVLSIAGSLITELDPTGTGSITRVAAMPGTNIGATSTAVMYRPGLILQVGGGAFFNGDDRPASNAATIIDVRSGAPVITAAAPMPTARHWATATVLPTGDVLVTGGTPHNTDTADGATTAPELWDPDTDTWRTLAPEAMPRMYHSVAALLPDGRVFSGGGGLPGPVLGLTSQVFSPPYLFDGSSPAARPAITGAPTTVRAGEDMEIMVDSARSITQVALVKTSAVTHSFNNDQRYIPLAFERSGSTVTAAAPANRYAMPPGWYQLWVVDSAGVPSVSEMVRVPPPN